MIVNALVAAAGSGTRLGFDTPKAFVQLAGRTLLERSLDALADSERIDRAVVLVSPDMREAAEGLVADPINRASWAGMSVSVALGGGERMDSVFAGLEELRRRGVTGSSLVAIHDAARCLVPPALIREVVDKAAEGVERQAWWGAVPVMPVTDTIKIVDEATSGPADGETLLEQTPNRDTLRAAQTPQVCELDALYEANLAYMRTTEISSAHASRQAGNQPLQLATDDASLLEMSGKRVVAVNGDLMAMKITTPLDYRIAEMLLNSDSKDVNRGLCDGTPR
ncbi:IspD/TarI family cytidylyltransferase [Corynebacterium anserum]|uniref:2-C-methyl-D-erythritol 4-phosphate cytidylyltransferase n=1 Tax=Corynebacterium anserum TaxID=2684406 RepID=A0A7G7YM39_9CORY|nr:2-C-methyl-D-erythritol 4-phosphate cytidylyltransferase [Corynebacterium anserum]MBC2681261.1 2-C-methyl-D-erythritol 4-phosphate cytidylyltransferase [Corynebacterium anserum]QNH95559.1 2-C-methyl-D-erythritol 4-phosphate cytidylyltransferase [Corynebacterium anserum]